MRVIEYAVEWLQDLKLRQGEIVSVYGRAYKYVRTERGTDTEYELVPIFEKKSNVPL